MGRKLGEGSGGIYSDEQPNKGGTGLLSCYDCYCKDNVPSGTGIEGTEQLPSRPAHINGSTDSVCPFNAQCLQCQGLDLLRRFVTPNFDTMATKL